MTSEIYAENILKLEEDIAFFFGVLEPALVAQHYIEAVKLSNNTESLNEQELRVAMIPHLEAAYGEVKRQTTFNFHVEKAALLELDLFMASKEGVSFEQEFALLVDVYQEVFGTITPQIKNAAFLRTFLYRYKNQLMSSGNQLSHDDVAFLKTLAEKTEIELSVYTKGSRPKVLAY